jgi:hypothetical protein
MLITFHNTFQGSKQNPAVEEVMLNTSPNEQGGTHWGQQVSFLSVFFSSLEFIISYNLYDLKLFINHFPSTNKHWLITEEYD